MRSAFRTQIVLPTIITLIVTVLAVVAILWAQDSWDTLSEGAKTIDQGKRVSLLENIE